MSADISSDRLQDILKMAQTAGADAADILFLDGLSLNTAQRLGKPESLERSEGQDLGLRVFVGQRQALVSTSDFKQESINELVRRAVAMAREVPEDEFCGLADADNLATDWPDLDLLDPVEKTADDLEDMAARAESAALEIDGVTNSEGAEVNWHHSNVLFAATNGFFGAYESSSFGLSVSVIAGHGATMERDYDFAQALHESDLRRPEDIGAKAAARAVARLNPKKVATCKVPVVYAPRVSSSLLRSFASGISGNAVARGTTFLKNLMDTEVFSKDITIIDDPHKKRGFRSRPFDGEGLPGSKRHIVENGVLNSWILDLRSARQLGLNSTGHASRGVAGVPSPSPSNLYIQPGAQTPEELVADISAGFYVTEMMGSAVSLITGDYSRGATGFWIENGEIAYPVSEVTIAGNLKDMWLSCAAANDLEFRTGIDAPTLRVEGMTVAGA